MITKKLVILDSWSCMQQRSFHLMMDVV